MNKQKNILIGVSGGIAAYKIASLVSSLTKDAYDVHVMMTSHATKLVGPATFAALSHNPVHIDTFEPQYAHTIPHISLAKDADLILLAPATANLIAKIAHGLADDIVTTTVLAATCPVLIAPAMNTHMLHNAATQDNLRILRERGYMIIDPANGHLACGDEGEGKLPEPSYLKECVNHVAGQDDLLSGKHVLVTAGPTREALDPVRYLTNRSSGKMGYAIAKMAAKHGAIVTLVSGPCALPDPPFVQTKHIESASDMADAVLSVADDQDIIIKAAAVADYRPASYSDEKIKKTDNELSIALERTDDILAALGQRKKEGQFLCGFSMETSDTEERAKEKLVRKNLDLIAANNVKETGAGFGVDTNILTLITKDEIKHLPLLSKEEAADALLATIADMIHP